MGMRWLILVGCSLTALGALPPISMTAGEGGFHARPKSDSDLPQGATRCDLSVPIQIKLVQLEEVRAGLPARFQVEIESDLDPDLVRDMRVEYDIPEKVRRVANAASAPQHLSRAGHSRLELGVIIPDQDRYRLRARLFVRLKDGRTISQTAVRWINSDKQPPEGMIGRIPLPDGSGIRVYRGVTIR
jgi:hypothetical protein